MSLEEFWQLAYLAVLHQTGLPAKAIERANKAIEHLKAARKDKRFD